jgi:predicted ArsR family transcriptional regulator
MDALSRRILEELADARSLTALEIAARLGAGHWADLSTVLGRLVAAGCISVTGPLGRAETTYRIHARGRAALEG